jgi:ubiquinone/menaquinone biosynthesis C-methylase UbiE
MEYIPELTEKGIEEVHKHYKERLAIYKNSGLDFDKYGEFLLDRAASFEDNILELGTGPGYTTVTLAKEGYKFTTIDTDEEALGTTAARLAYYKVLPNVTFYVMDATRLEFSDDSFKSIIAINLLHHVPDIEKLLLEADRVLCREGKIVISDFNKEGRKIIDKIHAEEGRLHDHPIADKVRIKSFFDERWYKTEGFDSGGHWILIAEKK